MCEHQYYVHNFVLVCSIFSIDQIFLNMPVQVWWWILAIKCINDAISINCFFYFKIVNQL